MPVTRSSRDGAAQGAAAEARVRKNNLPDASEDAYGGVIIEMKEPMDPDLFTSALRTSISQWRQQVYFCRKTCRKDSMPSISHLSIWKQGIGA